MKIVVDENVSYEVVIYLRNQGNTVLAVMENPNVGLNDLDIFKLVIEEKAILITRDHHFTNSLRFPPEDTLGILYLRKGNLSLKEETDLVKWVFTTFPISGFKGHLITISDYTLKIR